MTIDVERLIELARRATDDAPGAPVHLDEDEVERIVNILRPALPDLMTRWRRAKRIAERLREISEGLDDNRELAERPGTQPRRIGLGDRL